MTTRLVGERFPMRYVVPRGKVVHAGRLVDGYPITGHSIWPACNNVWDVPAEDAFPAETPVTCKACLRRIGRPMTRADELVTEIEARA